MEHLTVSDRLTPRRMIVYPRRYRPRPQSHWPLEDEDETGMITKGVNDLVTRRTLFPRPEISVPEHHTYTMKIPLGRELEPQDVDVNVDAKKHTVTINAKKEKHSEDGSFRAYKEFSTKVLLPTNVDLKEAKSFLTTDGAVKIQAPIQQTPIKISRSFFSLLPDWKNLGENLLLPLVFVSAVVIMYRFILFMNSQYRLYF